MYSISSNQFENVLGELGNVFLNDFNLNIHTPLIEGIGISWGWGVL